jgi:hypothetical protein
MSSAKSWTHLAADFHRSGFLVIKANDCFSALAADYGPTTNSHAMCFCANGVDIDFGIFEHPRNRKTAFVFDIRGEGFPGVVT